MKRTKKQTTSKSRGGGSDSKKSKFDSNNREICRLVMKDRRIKVSEIVQILGFVEDDVRRYLTENFKELHGRWHGGWLQFDEKYRRQKDSEKLLTIYKRDPKAFFRRFVTTDQFWVYHQNPDTTEHTAEKADDNETPSKKTKTSASMKKVGVIVFWDAFGIILIDFFKSNKVITPKYYTNLLQRLSEEMEKKRPKIGKQKRMLQLSENGVTASVEVRAKVYRLGFDDFQISNDCADLCPTSFYLVPNLQKAFQGRQFSSDKAVIDAVNAYFENLDEWTFKDGIKELQERWAKCIAARGDYFE